MLKEKEELDAKLYQIAPMKLTKEEMKLFREVTNCSICLKLLGNYKRVWERDHITSKFKGAAHRHCNLQYQQSKVIPVVFHNLKNYDGHHIMTQLEKYDDHKIDVIALTLEKYLTFKIKKQNDDIQMKFTVCY